MNTAIGKDAATRRAEEKDTSAVKTLHKALVILDSFAAAEMPLTVAEVAIKAGVTRPTAHRLVHTLIADGYLTQNPRDGRISPGYSVLRLASSLLDTNQMRLEALPHLDSLAHELGERANLGIIHRNELLYLAGVEKPSLPTIYSRFGKTAPAYCSSLGKAILAHLPESELNAYFAAVPLACRTRNTLTDETRLRAEFDEIRRMGYAVDREEHIPGHFCIASTIFLDGAPIGAIGVTTRALDPLIARVDLVQHAAEVISHVLSRGS